MDRQLPITRRRRPGHYNLVHLLRIHRIWSNFFAATWKLRDFKGHVDKLRQRSFKHEFCVKMHSRKSNNSCQDGGTRQFLDKFKVKSVAGDRPVLKEKVAALTLAYHHRNDFEESLCLLGRLQLRHQLMPHQSRLARHTLRVPCNWRMTLSFKVSRRTTVCTCFRRVLPGKSLSGCIVCP